MVKEEGASAVQPEAVLVRIARLARTLRKSMRELGLDQAIKDAAQAIPDARERLRHVASMTEDAANRVLDATEAIGPVQDALAKHGSELEALWKMAPDGQAPCGTDLGAKTRAFLREVQDGAHRTKASVRDIVMAQDFQDLTGQIILKMLNMVDTLETELVAVIVDNTPAQKCDEPALVPEANPAMASQAGPNFRQDDVDDLLSSLGF
ncbi:MAG: protein phosphatase CheZ [Candidimonas sp.]|nr:MAG: protein phosphatase CheZ [Candidimonas sp.]